MRAPHRVYRCAGADRWLAVAVTDDTQWRALCAAVPALRGLEELTEGQRRDQRSLVDAHISAWARDRDAIEAIDRLQAAGVPGGRVLL